MQKDKVHVQNDSMCVHHNNKHMQQIYSSALFSVSACVCSDLPQPPLAATTSKHNPNHFMRFDPSFKAPLRKAS